MPAGVNLAHNVSAPSLNRVTSEKVAYEGIRNLACVDEDES